MLHFIYIIQVYIAYHETFEQFPHSHLLERI